MEAIDKAALTLAACTVGAVIYAVTTGFYDNGRATAMSEACVAKGGVSVHLRDSKDDRVCLKRDLFVQ